MALFRYWLVLLVLIGLTWLILRVSGKQVSFWMVVLVWMVIYVSTLAILLGLSYLVEGGVL